MKKFTLGQFIDAIEKNGFVQNMQGLFGYDTRYYVTKACALGQAYLNLGIDAPNASTCDNEEAYMLWHRFANDVITMNDTKKRKIPTIVKAMRAKYADYLDVEIGFRSEQYAISPKAHKEKKS